MWLHGDADDRRWKIAVDGQKAGDPKSWYFAWARHSDITGPGLEESLPHIRAWFAEHL
jgi:hypothetical protein